MKMNIEYDDFGEYMEGYDGEGFYVAAEEEGRGKTIELILFQMEGGRY